MWNDVEKLLCKINKTDGEIEKTLPWFYENVKCFNHVKEEAVKQIIIKSEYAKIKKDHVIIRQGEVGDCCYIILRGIVSVYAKRIEDNDYTILDEPSTRTFVKNYKDRPKFGAEVSNLKNGDKFGDLCFYKSNNERNATAIADENLDLLVIDKNAYQIHLSEKFQDMKDQLRFMETSSLFKGFPYDYRITLLENMKVRRVHYGSVVVRQGDPVSSIFIVCRGEALLKLNPAKLSRQYHLVGSDGTFNIERPLTVIQRRRKILKYGYVAGEMLLKQRNMTVATVGQNEIIGDVEFVLNLATHHVTAVCNSAMLIMEMDMTELHRLILRRDVGISDVINTNVLTKLNSRANRCTNIPQYCELHKMAVKSINLKKANVGAEGKTRADAGRKSTLVSVANLLRIGTKFGEAAKLTGKPKTEQQAGSIVGAIKKTAAIALEIGSGSKVANKLLESEKKQDGPAETAGQDDVTGTRTTKAKGRTRKDAQGQEKEKKQFTVKEYRALKKKMQAAGKTITPLD